jgi:predicted permease
VLHRLRFRLRSLIRQESLDREMQAEMRAHLDRRVEVLVARGMAPDDARLAARKEFGNVGALQEEGRDAGGWGWLESLLGDIRFALRHFARRRLSTATIVAVLSLGIALHAVELTLLRIATVKPPPGISSSIPLVHVRGLYRPESETEWSGRWMPYPEVQQVAALDAVFSSVAMSSLAKVVLGSRTDEETAATVHFVNGDYFQTLGVNVSRGPGLPRSGPHRAGAELVAVVSEATWDRVLGRPDTIGQTLVVNGRAVRVVGVAPPRFASSIGSDNPGITIWMPLGSRPIILAGSGASAFALESPDSALFEVVGRLRDGVSADSATRAVRRVSAGVTAGIAQPTAQNLSRVLYDADAVDLRGITEVGEDDLLTIAGIWALVSTLILLVVCTNVSGLMAASAATRAREIAVRLSLGASRRRIVRQLLTESCLLSLAGAAVGVFIYWAAFRVVTSIPEAQYYAPDFGTLALTLVSAVGVGILFGLTPALHAARGDIRGVLNASGSGATGPTRLQRTLVAAQITLTQPLLVVIASLVGILLMNPPKQLPEAVHDQVAKFRIDVGLLGGSPDQRGAAMQRMFARIREVPGVVTVLPDADLGAPMMFAVPEQDRVAGTESGKEIHAGYQLVRPGFFKLLDVPLLRGDDAVIADSVRTIVIGTDMLRSLWGDVDPIGRYLEAAPPGGVKRRYLVTGIYDSRLIGESDKPVVYRTVRSWWPRRYLVRTSRPAAELMIPIRQAIRSELPTIPIDSWTTLADEQARRQKGERMIVMVIVGSTMVVLLISCIGLYGVVSLAVVQRQREIGIRMALGARAREVVAMLYRSGMKLSVIGLSIGLPISLVGGQILSSTEAAALELQDRPNVLLVGLGVGVVMLAVASLATVFPATRAATVEPASVLRSE